MTSEAAVWQGDGSCRAEGWWGVWACVRLTAATASFSPWTSKKSRMTSFSHGTCRMQKRPMDGKEGEDAKVPFLRCSAAQARRRRRAGAHLQCGVRLRAAAAQHTHAKLPLRRRRAARVRAALCRRRP
jgi:hypothetical protein